MYQMVKNIPNVQKIYKIYQHFRIYGPPKFTQIGIFGLKINHLASLVITMSLEEQIFRFRTKSLIPGVAFVPETTSELKRIQITVGRV
jgi:hypothetical protein